MLGVGHEGGAVGEPHPIADALDVHRRGVGDRGGRPGVVEHSLADLLRRPGVDYARLLDVVGGPKVDDPQVAEQVEIQIKYAGYIERQRVEIARQSNNEQLRIPEDFESRAAAYDASRYAIDQIKQRAPIWKEEHYVTGASRYLDGVPLTRKDS